MVVVVVVESVVDEVELSVVDGVDEVAGGWAPLGPVAPVGGHCVVDERAEVRSRFLERLLEVGAGGCRQLIHGVDEPVRPGVGGRAVVRRDGGVDGVQRGVQLVGVGRRDLAVDVAFRAASGQGRDRGERAPAAGGFCSSLASRRV